MKRNHPLSWHIVNASIGFALVLVITFILLFIIGLALGNPGLVSEKLGVPILLISCGIVIVGIAKRISKLSAKKNSEEKAFAYGFGFHFRNIALTLILLIALNITPAVVIPFSGISPQNAWIPLFISLIAITIFALTFASMRADKHLAKRKDIAEEQNEHG